MKLHLIKIAFIFFMLILTGSTLAQNIWGPNQTIYRRHLQKSGTEDVYSAGLATINTSFTIGKEYSLKKRAVYQWNITDNDIPDGSDITSVRLYFTYTKNDPLYEFPAYFYNISYDIVNPDQTQLNNMWDAMNLTSNSIGSITGTSNTIEYVSNVSSNPFNLAVKNSLPNDKFVLGIMWTEFSYIDFRTWNISNATLTLKIEYTPPQQTVTLDQRLSDNITQVGKLRKWEGTQFTPYPFINPGTPFDFPVGQPQTIQGDQAVYPNGNSSEKYNNWNDDKTDVKNHHPFTINPATTILTSKFEETRSGIKINNSLEGTTLDGGEVRFKDPWLIDYPDASYGGTLRNQGMSAPFKTQPSPFIPDYTSSYNGDVYRGIFLNQSGPPLWNNAYYSVGSLSEQTISVNSQNRKFYPFKWGGTGVTIQSEYWPETGIVFNNSSAVATGILKGQLMSNSTTGISSNSQRKMVRTDNGLYHVVYESMGNVFYTHSLTSNFDGEWAQDQIVLDHAKNPAIEYDGNIIKAVCEYYDPAYSANVDLYLLTFTQQANGRYENSDAEVFATCPSSYFGSAKPVIAYNAASVAIVYRKNTTEGLKQRTKWNNNGNWTWQAEATIPQTDANSINPSIIGETGKIHIAFESLSTIKYKLAYNQGTNWQYYSLVNLSTGSGFSQNNYPSISLSNSP